ncbi:MAG: RHS repeat-associated core domain-containing protein [Verrucomicrobiales bacterium]|nr:RHS repeat-associated core domain-containing protein [Verrucomicrobiales bacterium]
MDENGAPSSNRFRADSALWRTGLWLPPGSYQLLAQAQHPSGQSSADELRRFGVGLPPQSPASLDVESQYDGEGNLTTRTYRLGANLLKIQNYTWDLVGRLVQVIETSTTSLEGGFTWTARYDAMGRRLRTTTRATFEFPAGANGQTSFSEFTDFTETSAYDPLYEFLEIELATLRKAADNGPVLERRLYRKIHGPDLNGAYGSLNGIGGLEAVWTADGLGQTLEEGAPAALLRVEGMVTDAYGHTVAWLDGGTGTLTANPCLSRGYGPASGSYSPSLYEGATLTQATNWRGRRLDFTSLVCLGARYYELSSGRFISPDPAGHGESMSLYGYAAGDPVNGVDPTGRETEWGLRVGFSFSFGGPPSTTRGSSMYISAGVTEHFSANTSVSVDASARFYNSGLGTPAQLRNHPPVQPSIHYDFGIGVTGTYGSGRDSPMTPYTFNNFTPATMPNRYESSVSFGQHLNYNSATARSTVVMSLGLRTEDIFFGYHNDSPTNGSLSFIQHGKYGTDGGWTGGGYIMSLDPNGSGTINELAHDTFAHDRTFGDAEFDSDGHEYYLDRSGIGFAYNRGYDSLRSYDSSLGYLSGGDAFPILGENGKTELYGEGWVQTWLHTLRGLPYFRYFENNPDPNGLSQSAPKVPKTDPTGKFSKNGW